MVELEKLLKPCRTGAPAGDPIRYEPIYDQIKEARRADTPGLPQGIWAIAPKRANWPMVETLCTEVLMERSKDLEVTSWLIEAWTMLFGMDGLRQGLKFLKLLSQQYWPVLYPLVEPDVAKRLGPYGWLNQKFSERIGVIPITEDADGRGYTYDQWVDAVDAEEWVRKGKDTAEAIAARGQPAMETIRKAQVASSYAFYQNLIEQGEASIGYISDLHAFLGAKVPGADISLYRLQDKIQKILQVARQILKDRGPEKPVMPAQNPSLETPSEKGETRLMPDITQQQQLAPMPSEALHTRAEAYQQLERIAEYLATIEPHSPTPYLIRKAVAWGRMPLAELMADLAKEETNYMQFMKLLGMK